MPYFRDTKSTGKPNSVHPLPDFNTPEGGAMANDELSRLGTVVTKLETSVKKISSPIAAAPAQSDTPPAPPVIPTANKISVAHNGSTIASDVNRINFRDNDNTAIDVQGNGKTVNIGVRSLLESGSDILTVKDDGAVITSAATSIDFRDTPSLAFSVTQPTPGNIAVTGTASGSSLPAGTIHQTLRHNGTNWEATSRLLNYDSTNLGGGVVRMSAVVGDNVPQLYIDSSVATSQPLKIAATTLNPAVGITNTNGHCITAVSSGAQGVNSTGFSRGVVATATASNGIGLLATASGTTAIGVQSIAQTGKGILASATTGIGISTSASTGRALEATNSSTSSSAVYASNGGSGLAAIAIRANVATGTGIYSDAADGQSLSCYNNSGANPTALFKNDGSSSSTKVIDVDAQGMHGIYVENIYTGISFEPRAITAKCDNAIGIAVDARSQNGMAVSAVSLGDSSTVALNVEATLGTAGSFRNSGASGAPTVFIDSSAVTSIALQIQGRVAVSNGPIQITGFGLEIDGDTVLGPRSAGWSAATGTADRTTFDTAAVTLEELAQRVKALLDDLTAHGLIGP